MFVTVRFTGISKLFWMIYVIYRHSRQFAMIYVIYRHISAFYMHFYAILNYLCDFKANLWIFQAFLSYCNDLCDLQAYPCFLQVFTYCFGENWHTCFWQLKFWEVLYQEKEKKNKKREKPLYLKLCHFVAGFKKVSMKHMYFCECRDP